MSKAKRISDLQEWKREDVSDSKEWRDRAKESFRFYTAIRQWNQADLDQLIEEGRPHLTIPLITAIVNTVVGYQIDNEQQFKLYPRRGGTAAVAALGTELLKHTLDDCYAADHETEVFQDGCVGGVGVIEIQERNDNINKELLVRKKSPFNVIFDQNANDYEFDEKGRRVFEEVWLTKEQIQLGFHKSVKDLQQATEAPRFDEDVRFTEDYTAGSVERERERKGLYLVNKSYWRRWEKQVYVLDLKTFSAQVLHGPKMIQLAKNAMEIHNRQSAEMGIAPRLKIIERAGWKLYKTWFVGEMELLHEEDPWGGISDFPIKPYYPYWADGYAFGVVEGNKDAQRFLNKVFSKELETNPGWWVEDSSNDGAMDDLRQNGGKNNFIFRKDKFGDGDRLKPNKPFFDSEVTVQRLERFMNQISGVDPTMRGMQQGGKESGKALEKRLFAGVMVSKIVHKNFNRTLRKMGKFLWDAIRQRDENGDSKYYSQEEIEAIVQESSLKQFITAGANGQQAVDLSPFYEETIGNYGIKVATSPTTQTVRAENQDYLLRIAEVYAKLFGVPVIPPEILIKISDLPYKDDIIEYLKTLQKQPQPQPQPTRKARTA